MSRGSRGGEEDLYAVLEVDRTATASDIRRAYKRLALKWHPDKNPEDREHAEKMFKAVSRAYEVLSNEEARQRYDTYGLAGLDGSAEAAAAASSGGGGRHRGSHGGFGMGGDPFASMFGGGGGMFDNDPFFGGMGARGGPRGSGRPFAFAFHDPFEIFDQMFGDMMMGMDGRHRSQQPGPRQQQPRSGQHASSRRTTGDPMQDMMSMMMGGGGMGMGMGMGGMDMMGGGGGGGFSSFSSSSFSSMGGGGGVSQSTSTTTQIVNGQKVTRTVRRTTNPDGTVHEDVDERVEELGGGNGVGRIGGASTRGGSQRSITGGGRGGQPQHSSSSSGYQPHASPSQFGGSGAFGSNATDYFYGNGQR